MNHLIAVDYIILGIMLTSAMIGLLRGFTREVFSIIGWIVAIYTAIYALPLLQPIIQPYISPKWMITTLILVVTFMITIFLIAYVTNKFVRTLRNHHIGMLDYTLGGIFGFIRGGFVIIFIYFILELIIPVTQQPVWIVEAYLWSYVQKAKNITIQIIPLDNISETLPIIDDILEIKTFTNSITHAEKIP